MYSKQVQSPVETIRSLGSRFRDYRMRMNMTQKEIAEITTISIPTIYKFETGRLTDMSIARSNFIKVITRFGADKRKTNYQYADFGKERCKCPKR